MSKERRLGRGLAALLGTSPQATPETERTEPAPTQPASSEPAPHLKPKIHEGASTIPAPHTIRIDGARASACNQCRPS